MAEHADDRRLLVVHWEGADEDVLAPLLAAGQLPALSGLLDTGVRRTLQAEAADAPSLWHTVAAGRAGSAWWGRARSSGHTTHVVGWPYGSPARGAGITVAPTFSQSDEEAVDPVSARASLAPCRLDVSEITASVLAAFVPRLAKAEGSLGREITRPLQVLAEAIASMASLHAAATSLLEQTSWDTAALHYAGLAGLGAQFSRFHPRSVLPVPDGLRDWFGSVEESAARFHDMMLDRLLSLAGEDAQVVLVALPRVDPLNSTTLDGFVCVRSASPVAAAPVATEEVASLIADLFAFDLTSANAVSSGDGSPSAPGLQAAQFEQARALMQRGQPSAALPILTALYADGHRPSHGMQLLLCQLRLKRPADARTTLDTLLAKRVDRRDSSEDEVVLPAPLALLQAKVLRAEKSYQEAYDSLKIAEARAPQTALFYRRLGAVYLQLHAWADAERAFRHALTIAPKFPPAHRWLAVALIRQGRFDEALDAATRAAELRDPFPAAHYHRAMALLRLGRPAEAAEAAEVCVAQQPSFDRARYLLTQLYRDHLDQPAKAMKHLLASPPPTS